MSDSMQDYDNRHEYHAALYGSQSKVAIPRLARQERPPAKQQSRNRDRVQRACRNCHKRKVKCSGDLPRCNFCEKVNRPCIYEATRRDRLATATDRNEHLVSLLRDLSVRVDNDDRARIENALIDPEEDGDSPEPSSASRSAQFPTTPFSQHSEFSRRPSRSQTSPLPALYIPDADGSSSATDHNLSAGPQEYSYDQESLRDDATPAPNEHEAVYLGQICEVQWLRSLKTRLQIRDLAFPAIASSKDTNFYFDDEGIETLPRDNPFQLPTQDLATVLFQCYFQTVHVTFPIVPVDLQNQLLIFYQSIQNARSMNLPQRWYGIVNVVLAIGARFSRLIDAEWHIDLLDEKMYISRASQLLGLRDPTAVFTNPDLSLVQAYGLLAFYHMAVGHVNRAWMLVGTALRLALSLGFHAYSQTSHASPHRQQVVVETWWSIHNLEYLLSSMSGRPSLIQSEEVSTPLPSDLTGKWTRFEPSHTLPMSYADAQIRIAVIIQEVLSKLYTERRVARSWGQMHAIITAMMSELDEWAMEAVQQQEKESQPMSRHDLQQIMLKKQYCRAKILITRPSLRRIERCTEAGTETFTLFDQEAAEACIKTAHEVAALLPAVVGVKGLYEKGPWWTVTHNIMQGLAVLLIGISCRKHFEPSYTTSVASAKTLITWLQYMRQTNETADRGYKVVYGIVKAPDSVDPFVWADLAGVFPDELQPPIQHIHAGQRFAPWTAEHSGLLHPFEYTEGAYGFQHPPPA